MNAVKVSCHKKEVENHRLQQTEALPKKECE